MTLHLTSITRSAVIRGPITITIGHKIIVIDAGEGRVLSISKAEAIALQTALDEALRGVRR